MPARLRAGIDRYASTRGRADGRLKPGAAGALRAPLRRGGRGRRVPLLAVSPLGRGQARGGGRRRPGRPVVA
eukprot:289391-Lingulodinium_polyedra.AAC.1